MVEENNKVEKLNDKMKDKVNNVKYNSDHEKSLDVPLVPEAPKKPKIRSDSPGLSSEIINKMKNLENDSVKVVLVNCERCRSVIPIPVPKSIISKSELPIVSLTYVHKNKDLKDQHCITIFLDHDFDVRRQRISDIIFSDD
jgi:hypothetical protein